jgi:hypothetical protein
LIDQDRGAAMAALLKNTKYESDATLRSKGCLSEDDLKGLPAAYQFAAPTPHVATNDEIVKARLDAINDALNQTEGSDGDFQKLAATPFASFRVAPSGGGSSKFGAAGLQAIRSYAYAVRCATSGKNQQDPTMIAAILAGDSRKQPVILHYGSGPNGRLFEVEEASVDDIRAELGLDSNQWPDPKPSCKLS